MHLLSQILVLVLTAASALALSSPPSGAITVGSGGKYSTLSAALQDTSSSTYFIYSGTYKEQVYITRGNIKVYGQTNTAGSYTGNTVTITAGKDATAAGGDDPSGTVRVHADNVAFYNLNIANTFGQGSQAIALSLYGTNFGGYGLKITGYQDTLLAEYGNSYISQSYISGATDFIFGQASNLWIQSSSIVTVGNGYITASGRHSDDSTWYVINQSTISGTGSTYLGRPWANYARVVFQSSSLGSNVNPAGWTQWSSSSPNTDHVTFAEYQNTGAGASGTRASFSKKLSSAVQMSTLFGSNTPSWIDKSFLPGGSVTTTASSTTSTLTSTTPSTSTTTTTTISSPTGSGTVAQYGQCGGIGYTGPTTCVSPYKCTYSNDYYSQCV